MSGHKGESGVPGNITSEIISQFIQDLTPTPTKEKPIHFWVNGYCFRNDGESLYIQIDYEKNEFKKITRQEFTELTGIK